MAKSLGRLGNLYRSEYQAWANLKRWCNSPSHPSYRHYGGQGIKVYPQWEKSFAQFLKEVGPKPQPHLWLCRIDLNRGYEPGNVVWMERERQWAKRRSCLLLNIGGLPMTTREAAELLGLRKGTLLERLRRLKPRATP